MEQKNHMANASIISKTANKTESKINENANYVVNQLTSVFKNLLSEDKAHVT